MSTLQKSLTQVWLYEERLISPPGIALDIPRNGYENWTSTSFQKFAQLYVQEPSLHEKL